MDLAITLFMIVAMCTKEFWLGFVEGLFKNK
jgi:hypothetical protein